MASAIDPNQKLLYVITNSQEQDFMPQFSNTREVMDAVSQVDVEVHGITHGSVHEFAFDTNNRSLVLTYVKARPGKFGAPNKFEQYMNVRKNFIWPIDTHNLKHTHAGCYVFNRILKLLSDQNCQAPELVNGDGENLTDFFKSPDEKDDFAMLWEDLRQHFQLLVDANARTVPVRFVTTIGKDIDSNAWYVVKTTNTSALLNLFRGAQIISLYDNDCMVESESRKLTDLYLVLK